VRERERNEREREKKHGTACVHVCVFGEGECVHAYVHFRAGFYVTRIPNTLRNRNAEHHETVECEYSRERQYTMLRLSSTFLSVYPCICVNSFYFIYSCYQLPACACVCVCVCVGSMCMLSISHMHRWFWGRLSKHFSATVGSMVWLESCRSSSSQISMYATTGVSWSQTEDDIEIEVLLPGGCRRADFKVDPVYMCDFGYGNCIMFVQEATCRRAKRVHVPKYVRCYSYAHSYGRW